MCITEQVLEKQLDGQVVLMKRWKTSEQKRSQYREIYEALVAEEKEEERLRIEENIFQVFEDNDPEGLGNQHRGGHMLLGVNQLPDDIVHRTQCGRGSRPLDSKEVGKKCKPIDQLKSHFSLVGENDISQSSVLPQLI